MLVDVQQDFLDNPGLQPSAAVLVSTLAGLLDRARRSGWAIFHIQTQIPIDQADWLPHWREAGHAPCLIGTVGARPPQSLAPIQGEPVFVKRHFSGFEDTELAATLRREGIESVVLAGVHTHACVRETAVAASALGFKVWVLTDAVGSYDAEHARLTLEWLEGRVARCVSETQLWQLLAPEDLQPEPSLRPSSGRVWQHHNPVDWQQVLDEIPLLDAEAVAATADRVMAAQADWSRMPVGERLSRLETWLQRLEQGRATWIDALVQDLGKPRRDAEAEVAYGLALAAEACRELQTVDSGEHPRVRYRPLGLVGLITPWNNPFAIPLGKLVPALGFGNGVLWKPALPASNLSRRLHATLTDCGLDALVGLVIGDAVTGRALLEVAALSAVSFTGSVSVGASLAASCGRRRLPLQAELGGNNAAIVMPGVDLAEVAADLAASMFSFAGQRCTAIRRLIVDQRISADFCAAFGAEVARLQVGLPDSCRVTLGPVISREQQGWLEQQVDTALAKGARVLARAELPNGLPETGCWVPPQVLTDLDVQSPVWQQELFGPVAALVVVDGLQAALQRHNEVRQGLLGVLYAPGRASQQQFMADARAGLLSINRARPAFAASGPFHGWGDSGLGIPEHGRWNREFYTRVQGVYGGVIN